MMIMWCASWELQSRRFSFGTGSGGGGGGGGKRWRQEFRVSLRTIFKVQTLGLDFVNPFPQEYICVPKLPTVFISSFYP
jgi:hypothetical protein